MPHGTSLHCACCCLLLLLCRLAKPLERLKQKHAGFNQRMVSGRCSSWAITRAGTVHAYHHMVVLCTQHLAACQTWLHLL